MRLSFEEPAIKSVGNSSTFYKDLTDKKEIQLAFMVLAESVVERMIKKGIKTCHTLSIVVRDSDLKFYQKQCQIPPSRSSDIFAKYAEKLFFENYSSKKVRLLGISVSGFDEETQLSFFSQEDKKLDEIMLSIRNKFGHNSIKRASALTNEKIASSMDRVQLDKNGDD